MPFRQVIVGTDGSTAAADAIRQANALRAEGGELLILSVAETYLAGHTGLEAVAWEERIRAGAEDARKAAEDVLAGEARTEARVTRGKAGEELIAWARRMGADLLAVGSRGGGRL